MPRPFDFDAAVRRARERSMMPRPTQAPSAGQMRLFGAEEFLRPDLIRPDRYETKGMVLDAEGLLFSRAVCLHSAPKATAARRYAEIVGTAMRRKWKLWWVELFAGPGELYVRETGDFVPGSPLEALAIKYPFDGYVFADLDPRCTESLRRRLGGRANAFVLEGDSNSAEILDQIAAIVPKNALVVLYGDQEGLDLELDTVKYFIQRYPHLDLLLNLPVAGAVRALAAGHDGKAGTMLGHEEPRRLVEGINERGARGASVREWYRRQLAAEGFDKLHAVTVRLAGKNVPLYDLLLASRHGLAAKFFTYAVDFPEARWKATG